jgi:hypothetical protein
VDASKGAQAIFKARFALGFGSVDAGGLKPHSARDSIVDRDGY